MLDGYKSKFLNKSGRYRFYKENYENLLEINHKQKEEIHSLRKELLLLKYASSNSLMKLLDSPFLVTEYFGLFEDSLKKISDLNNEKNYCPICEKSALTFLPINGRENALCYNCGSFERQRFIYLYLKENTSIFKEKINFLHFAPEESFYYEFKNRDNIDYITADIEDKNHVDKVMDICSIDFDDNHFDYIMANHVLEHVTDDIKAMNELYRVVKSDGHVILTVPLFRQYEKTLENKEYNTDELRLKYYGQKDHMRAYGLDFPKRLEKAGFRVKKVEITDVYDKKEISKYGLSFGDIIFDCKK